ncbi:hypothetical protein QJ854_gp881 [Moumouvirus goulette]|uniref:Uncharacterized protein n=1 Tax=Moumouvirus goulette TaxID=1247379 RepID=M1PLW4_9VIRU|nr:hypothetical protein QJ854_gp881 [Moumouvirus goulette]AGF84901.1 hypothetical protein glt_00092 [Moumouvirus goulette]
MSRNEKFTEEFFDIVEEFGNKYLDVQEKCNIWRQVISTGRKECTEAKRKLFLDTIRASKKSGVVINFY